MIIVIHLCGIFGSTHGVRQTIEFLIEKNYKFLLVYSFFYTEVQLLKLTKPKAGVKANGGTYYSILKFVMVAR